MRARKRGGRMAAVLLALALMLPAYASGAPAVSLSSGEVRPGEAVTLTLSIEGNPGIAAALVYFYYDTGALTVDPGRDIAGAGSFRSSGGVIGNSIATARENGRYFGQPGAEGALALWFNGSGLNTTGDGAFLTVTFHAAADAPEGEYPIGVGYSADDVCNEKGENVVLRTSGGTVTVKAEAEVQTDPIPEPNEPEIQDLLDGTAGDVTPETQPGKPQETPPETQPETPAETEETPDETEPDTPAESAPEEPQTPMEGAAAAPVFADVAGNWAERYIKEIAELGLMNGMENNTFQPDSTMTRAMFATILWRAAGSPEPTGAATFADMPQGEMWYSKAVAWAEETGAMNGVEGHRFDLSGEVTRQQLVTVLHRLAGTPMGMETMLYSVYDGTYTDSAQVGTWAKAALYWAVYNEIYCGQGSLDVGAALAPTAPADRAQIAVMMVRYLDR